MTAETIFLAAPDETRLWDEEAEACVLGCAIIGGASVAEGVLAAAKPEWFRHPAHRIVIAAMQDMIGAGTLDLVALKHKLVERGQLEDVGGDFALMQLLEIVPSGANWRYHLESVRRCWVRREVIRRAEKVQRLAQEPDLAECFTALTGLGDGLSPETSHTVRFADIDLEDSTDLRGVSSGYQRIDDAIDTYGYPRREVSLVIAGTKAGKTSFMLASALSDPVLHVGYATLEMGAKQLMRRCMRQLTGWSKPPDRDLMARDDWFREARELAKRPWRFYDPSGETNPVHLVEHLSAWAIDQHLAEPFDVIFVDYAQLLSTRKKSRDEWTELIHVTRSLVGLAKKLGVPLVVGSQVSVGADGKLSPRGTKELQNACGWMLLLHRKPDELSGEIEIALSRHGKSGVKYPVRWSETRLRFEE